MHFLPVFFDLMGLITREEKKPTCKAAMNYGSETYQIHR